MIIINKMKRAQIDNWNAEVNKKFEELLKPYRPNDCKLVYYKNYKRVFNTAYEFAENCEKDDLFDATIVTWRFNGSSWEIAGTFLNSRDLECNPADLAYTVIYQPRI